MNQHVKITTVKITTVGNSVGITLPKDVLTKLRVGKGDTICITETPDGVTLTPYQREFSDQMELAERIMRDNRDALRELAK